MYSDYNEFYTIHIKPSRLGIPHIRGRVVGADVYPSKASGSTDAEAKPASTAGSHRTKPELTLLRHGREDTTN